MIDEQLDADFEQLIRATLAEMIPKAHVAAARAKTTGSSVGPTHATVELLESAGGGPRRPRALALAAATMLVVGAGAIGALVLVHEKPAPPVQQSPVDEPDALPTTPLRPDVFPIIPDSFPRADAASAMYGGQIGWGSEGAGALVARRLNDGIADGIRLSVVATSDSTAYASGAAEKLTIAGTEVDVYTEGGTPIQKTVVARGALAYVAWGLDPVGFLEAAGGFPISGARVVGDGSVTFEVSALPAGYELVVPPGRYPFGSISASTRVPDGDGGDGIAVWVDVQNSLLSSASAGNLAAVEINGTKGWARDVGRGSTVVWPVSATTWAMVAGASSLDDALALARAVSFADEATWQARYGVVEPEYPSDED